jgi:hypothetical protein
MSHGTALGAPQAHIEYSKSPPSIFTLIKGAFGEAWRDISSIPWRSLSQSRHFWWQFMASAWFSLLLALLLFLSFWMGSQSTSPCRADGDFQLKISTDTGDFIYVVDWWALKGFFQVSLGLGKLDFTSAKVIDVVWDLVRLRSSFIRIIIMTQIH